MYDATIDKLVNEYLTKEEAKDWLDNHDPFEDCDIKSCEYCGMPKKHLVKIADKWPFNNKTIERNICKKCIDELKTK